MKSLKNSLQNEKKYLQIVGICDTILEESELVSGKSGKIPTLSFVFIKKGGCIAGSINNVKNRRFG